MLDVEVIDDPAAAVVALDPVRARLLAELAEPASAAALAERVGLTRQKINYHLRTLEAHGLVRIAERAALGRPDRAAAGRHAASYVVSPGALGEAASDPRRTADRLSARYLIALGVADRSRGRGLARRAEAQDKRLRHARDRHRDPLSLRGRARRASLVDLAGAVTAPRIHATTTNRRPAAAATASSSQPTPYRRRPHDRVPRSMQRRKIEVEVEVPGTPEQVWEAIATGPGIAAWFAPADFEQRVGALDRSSTWAPRMEASRRR